MAGLGCFYAQGDLVGDADAVAFEGDDFFRVIGEDANVLEAEVNQDLRADATLVLEPFLPVGRAEAVIAKPGAGLVEINQHTGALGGD